MRTKCIIISLLISLALTGCKGSDKKLINDDSVGTGSFTDATENSAVKKDKELLPDWSNWTTGALGYGYGCAGNLVANEKGEMMNADTVSVIDDKLTVYLYNKVEIDEYEYEGSSRSTFFVLVNGKVCDFELDGQKSTGGRIFRELEYQKDYLEKLIISDCDLKVGTNTITVLCPHYFPQIGHASGGYITRDFHSDIEKTQSNTIALNASELSGAEFVKGDKASPESDFIFDQLSFDASKLCMTIPPNGVSGYKQANAKPGDTKTLDRRIICLAMKNGELLPAWDGAEFLSADLTADTADVSLPFSCNIGDGEYAHISYFIYDIEADHFRVDERLFLGKEN